MAELPNASIKQIFDNPDFRVNSIGDDDIFILFSNATNETVAVKAVDFLPNTTPVVEQQWNSTQTYNTNDAVIYQGQWWISQLDNNTGNIPVEGANWSAENKQTTITLKPWGTGIYEEVYVVRTVGNDIYRLRDSVSVPFNSQTSPDLDPTNWERIGTSSAQNIEFDDTNTQIIKNTNLQAVNEDLDDELVLLQSTGIIEGGVLTQNSTDSIDLTALTGRILDSSNPTSLTLTKITATSKTAFSITVTDPLTYLYYDDNSDVLKTTTAQPTRAQRRSRIYVGAVACDGTEIVGLVNDKDFILQQGSQLRDIATFIGVGKFTDITPSATGANLNIDVNSGTLFDFGSGSIGNPHFVTFSGASVANFNYVRSDGNVFTQTNTIEPSTYESSPGTLAAVPSNDWTIQPIYVFKDNSIAVAYGQKAYQTKADAQSGILFDSVTKPTVLQGGVKIGYLVIKQGATVLNDDTQAVIFPTNKFGEFGGGASSTSTLTDTDDLPEGSNNLYFTDQRAIDAVVKILKQTIKFLDTAETFEFTQANDFRINSLNVETGVTVTIKLSDGTTDYILGDTVTAFDYLIFSVDTIGAFEINGEIL